MLKTTSPTRLSGVLLSLIDMAEKDEIGNGDSNGMKFTFTITFKKATRANYLNFKGIVGTRGFEYLTSDHKKAFNHLWHSFTKATIFQHFDLKCYIRVKTNTSGHAIAEILCQVILDDGGRWHLVAYYLCKMILAKTRYKIHDN